jgi:7,8-dihydropterin-6-yl-methyl-4-(beta-D-ribofuranosyl)aminobenzene 5'-phosphate synthase
MDIRVPTLSENTANYGFLGEWGLSILVEADGKKILLDTGHGLSAVHNADKMGEDLSGLDAIVLSHGHIDHTGGLLEVLSRTGGADVICHPTLWEGKHVSFGPDAHRHVGTQATREELEAAGARFIISREPVAITANITTTGEVAMTTGYEQVDANLTVKQGETVSPDPLEDDLALVIDAEYGLVIISGCAHRGIINTIRHAQKIRGKDKVYAVIGGTHLILADENRLDCTVADLKAMGIKKLGVSHCTGFAASARLAKEFPGVFFLNNAGSRWNLP